MVDGRSKDKTREIASSFPVELIVAPSKDTYGTSRNIGVKAATGDIIAFLDADDYAERDWLDNLVKVFNHSDADVINVKRVYVYSHNWFTDFKWNKMRTKHRSDNCLPVGEELWMTFATSGSAFRGGVIEKAGYFDEDMFFGTEDKDLVIRVLRLGNDIVSVPNTIIYFKPASSIKEWFKEAFCRHGLGHGTIRRKYGKSAPSLIIPIFTLFTIFCFLLLSAYSLWQLMLLVFLVPILGITIKTRKLFKKTKELTPSLAYTVLEILARNLEFLGFTIGYVISPQILRKITGH